MLINKINWLERSRTYNLRGICMLMIMFHHINNKLGHVFSFMNGWGYIATGIFLFLSGFGLFVSLKKRNTPPQLRLDKI